MNGPKVSTFVALVKFGYMLENPRISEYSPLKWQLTNSGVRTISRKGQLVKHELSWNPQRPHAERLSSDSRRYGPDCMATCRVRQK